MLRRLAFAAAMSFATLGAQAVSLDEEGAAADHRRAEATLRTTPTSEYQLSVLSYNIHGLPAWIAGDDPAVRIPRIGRHLNGHDIVLVQEDFAFHELLVEAINHRVRVRGNGARSWLLGKLFMFCGYCGSGLTVLADVQPSQIVAMDRVAFSSCHGWLGSGHDCWASKGFVRLRLRLGEGAAVDLYGVHLDAGRAAGDRAVRAGQLDELRRAVIAHSHEHALVVGGDFNLEWSDPGDREQLRQFARDVQLVDVATDHPGFAADRVDYLLYRSGRDVSLSVEEAGVVDALSLAGDAPLSDHAALFARVTARWR